MRDKVTTRSIHELTPAAKARVRRDLRKGDRPVIAEVARTTPDYVRKVITERRADNSTLARRIWLAAHRITTDRNRLKGELGA
ncbi:MAG: hypothetical protein JNJ91_05210 [Flavobacteriales bacterium]|nr:hypothetical protein [Flavobacteriales bacterium]